MVDIKTLKKYIKDNSTAGSRSNSYYVDPKLVSHSSSHFEFTYDGNSGYDYRILVDFRNGIETSCNCPYKNNYPGICKHVIASLNTIIVNYADQIVNAITTGQNVDLFGNIIPAKIIEIKKTIPEIKYQSDKILLPEAIITDEIIEEWTVKPDNRHKSPDELQIVEVDKNEVHFQLKGWYSYNQVLKFDPKTNRLDFKCNCARHKKMCEHLGTALKNIVKIFGNDLFTEDYFQKKIEKTVVENGFSLEEDYHFIFNFELTSRGFQASYKVDNLVSDSRDISILVENDLDDMSIKLPQFSKVTDNFGLGIFFEFYRKTFLRTSLFQAKYNKTKTDFSSSVVPINSRNFEDSLMVYDSAEEQKIILKTILIDRSLSKFNSSNDIQYLKKAISANADFLKLIENKFNYIFDSGKSLVRKNLTPAKIENKDLKLFFSLTETHYFYTLKAKLRIEDKNYNLNTAALQISPLYIFSDDLIIPITDARLSAYILHYQKFSEINYLKKDTPEFFDKIIKPLSKKFEIQSAVLKKSKAKTGEELLEKQVYLTDYVGEFITFKLAVKYKDQLVDVLSTEFLFDENQKKLLERNQSFEDNFVEEFRSLHANFETQENIFFLTPEELFENHWMLHSIERMKQLGITVFGANDLKSFKFNLNKPVIQVNLKSDIDWFDIEIDISFGKQKVNIKELQKAFLKKSNYVTLGDGTLGILPEEWMKKFANYFKTGEVKKNGIQMSNYQFGIIDELYQEMDSKPAFLEELYHKKMRLQNIAEIKTIAIPKGIKAKLRDYQHHGLNWLAFLDKNQLGGCLADDMGLGKTLQTIAFLQHLKVTNPKIQPSLIIAPTSLIFNWKNEIEKFCPTLKMLTFTGLNRHESKDDFKKYDLIISTYGSLLNDIEFLKDFKFHYVILDESQAIKNPNSKRYKAVRLLNSYNKIALTGTPIENNTFDLYAQLNFLNPGLLGNMTHFKNNFSDAIDKEKEVEASLLLSKIITPFMLRRTKEQVATELPEKTESIIFCEMEKEQRAVYNTFKNQYRDYLLNKIDEYGVEKSQMYILEGLTKLRQICNSTALIPSEEDFGNYSVKLETLIENIKEKTGNHKILVFSQFVKMLQIVKTRLEEEHISYEYLDGQTSNRQERVENFQNNADVRVFLISLKAGGTGLNLTEADYVFIIDPWWNPAVENQAIDRCYRIGQTKKVMAYRMICKDSIEEKIVSLQQKKKNVASSIISIDDEKKSFNINEVRELFN